MGLVERKIWVEGDKGRARLETLFDGGASLSLVRRDSVRGIAMVLRLRRPLRLEVRDGDTLVARGATRLTFRVEGCDIFDDVLVAERLSEQCIIGARTMQKWGIRLDPEHEAVRLDRRKVRTLKLVGLARYDRRPRR